MNDHPGRIIRILGTINRVSPNVTTYCQIWFNGENAPVIAQTYEYKYIWNVKWGNNHDWIDQPYLTSCEIPIKLKDKIPEAVSLVEEQCANATNNLRVIYDAPVTPEDKKGFAVCVKGLDFLHDDMSVRLVEWIELLTIIGIDKIYFYELNVHPNITKVLQHYEREGKIHVTKLTLPGNKPNFPGLQHLYLKKKVVHKRQNELIPYNDCFYKNMYKYDYIALLDTDEIIMPLNDTLTYDSLMTEMKKTTTTNDSISSYCFRNVYFLDNINHDHEWEEDVPHYLHMMQHVYRTENYTKPGFYVKCFHNTQRIHMLHNHYPFGCINGGCKPQSVGTEYAHLQHYRSDCVKELKSCGEMKQHQLIDKTIRKYKNKLVQRSIKALNLLGFFGT